MFVKSCNKFRPIFDQLIREGKAYTKDINISRSFGRMYPELIEKEFLDIARTSRKKETIFITRPFVRIKPMKRETYDFYKIL